MVSNTRTWILWLAASMLYCILTYNPVYQILLLSALLSITIRFKLSMRQYAKTALIMSLIPLAVNTLLVHSGNTTIYEIPKSLSILGYAVPIPLVGGPLTAESILTGLVMSVFLLNMLTTFQAFNKLSNPDSLLHLIPSAFPSIALTSSITLRFIPSVLEDYNSIRDAQVSRGVRMSSGSQAAKIKNQLGVIVPTLITSLERSFNMAESMASRGYSSGRRSVFKREQASQSDKALSVLYLISIMLTLYASYNGLFNYWPYDSLRLPALSALALAPLLLISAPIFLKDENDRKR
ncbi:MAG: energy-coupling factor transporter transmembrane component T [Candidatus Altiarchaeota archaeon]|nr:energy-coupling factor transporter transmembrane component T [Candidatus Altiarchaeota archaeon]